MFDAWTRQLDVLKSKFPSALCFCVGDFNARVGSTPFPYIGTAGADLEDERGERLRLECDHHHIYVANTFIDCGYTWTHSNGSHSRIDFVASSLTTNCIAGCDVFRHVDLAMSLKRDHELVVVSYRVFPKPCSDNKSCKKAISDGQRAYSLCQHKLSDPALLEQFKTASSLICMYDPSIGIDANTDIVANHIYECGKIFKRDPARPHKSWLTDETWHAIRQTALARKCHKHVSAWTRTFRAATVFVAWRALRRSVYAYSVHVYDAYVAQYDFLCAWQTKSFTLWRNHSRALCRKDKSARLENLILQADDAANKHDSRRMYQIIKAFGSFTRTPIRAIHNSSGVPTLGEDEYIQRWLQHFAGVFGASAIDGPLQSSAVSQPFFPRQGECLEAPSRSRTDKALANLPNNKAVGCDGARGEVIKLCAEPVFAFFIVG